MDTSNVSVSPTSHGIGTSQDFGPTTESFLCHKIPTMSVTRKTGIHIFIFILVLFYLNMSVSCLGKFDDNDMGCKRSWRLPVRIQPLISASINDNDLTCTFAFTFLSASLVVYLRPFLEAL